MRIAGIVLCLMCFGFVFSGCKSTPCFKLEQHITLENYPSGSALVYFNEQVFIAGDDAPSLLHTDINGNKKRNIILYPGQQGRIAKSEKADIEAGTAFTGSKGNGLLFLGSGSHPKRKVAWVIDPYSNVISNYFIDTFYNRLEAAGIAVVNIEALAQISGWMILGNRGNNAYKKNFLILAENRFWEKQQTARFHTIHLGTIPPSGDFAAVSGMDYDYRSDKLYLTYSTEKTGSAYDDGAVGNSYLAVVRDVSGKLNYAAINPNEYYALADIDAAFLQRKVESVAVAKSGKKETTLLLIADNDDGRSHYFKLAMKH